jgi:uncharacterized membrane protein (UPF0182 family)
VPADPANHGSGLKQPPYYLLTQFPGEEGQSFQLTAALTPAKRQNLAALMTGRYVNGKPQLEVLELPRENRIPGPGQAYQNMANDPTARQQLNLLNSNNSTVVYGNLLSLPYGGGMLYVQPVYVQSADVANPIPLMKKVLVSYGDQVGYADTLTDALAQLVQKGSASPSQPTNPSQPSNPSKPANPGTGGQLTPELSAAAAKIQTAIDKLQAAQKAGDFEAYGKALAELNAAVKEFEAAQAKATGSPTPAPAPTGSTAPSTAPSGAPSPTPSR